MWCTTTMSVMPITPSRTRISFTAEALALPPALRMTMHPVLGISQAHLRAAGNLTRFEIKEHRRICSRVATADYVDVSRQVLRTITACVAFQVT